MSAGRCTVHDCMTCRPSSFNTWWRMEEHHSDHKKILCSPLDKFRASTARDVGVIVHRRTNGDVQGLLSVMVRKTVDFERLGVGPDPKISAGAEGRWLHLIFFLYSIYRDRVDTPLLNALLSYPFHKPFHRGSQHCPLRPMHGADRRRRSARSR